MSPMENLRLTRGPTDASLNCKIYVTTSFYEPFRAGKYNEKKTIFPI